MAATQNSFTSLSKFLATLLPTIAFTLVSFLAFIILRRRLPLWYETIKSLVVTETHRSGAGRGCWDRIVSVHQIRDQDISRCRTVDSYLSLRYLRVCSVLCLLGFIINLCTVLPVLAALKIQGHLMLSGLEILTVSIFDGQVWAQTLLACSSSVFFLMSVWLTRRELHFGVYLRHERLRQLQGCVSARTVLYTATSNSLHCMALLKECYDSAIKISCSKAPEGYASLIRRRQILIDQIEAVEANEKTALPARERSKMFQELHKVNSNIGVGKSEATSNQGGSPAIFATFSTLDDAQMAAREVVSHDIHARGIVNVEPHQIIWDNVGQTKRTRDLRQLSTLVVTILLIVFWTLPFASIGALSEAASKNATLPVFAWTRRLPEAVVGIVTGLLPAVLANLALALMPWVCRMLAIFGGSLTTLQAELKSQQIFFAFQVVQIFLVTALGTTAWSVIRDISKTPVDAVSILAENLPNASKFYLCYFMVQGLVIAIGVLLNLSRLLILAITCRLFDNTPRKKAKRLLCLSQNGWGTILPTFETLTVIVLCYTSIAPLIGLFGAMTLHLAYLAYKYNVLFVSSAVVDTHGGLFIAALRHLFTGIVIGELTLVGVFASQIAKSKASIAPLIVMLSTLGLSLWLFSSDWTWSNQVSIYAPRSLHSVNDDVADREGLGARWPIHDPHTEAGRIIKQFDAQEDNTCDQAVAYTPTWHNDKAVLWLPAIPKGIDTSIEVCSRGLSSSSFLHLKEIPRPIRQNILQTNGLCNLSM